MSYCPHCGKKKQTKRKRSIKRAPSLRIGNYRSSTAQQMIGNILMVIIALVLIAMFLQGAS